MVKKPSKPERKTAPVSVRLDPQTKADLEAAARADDRSISRYIERLIRAHLARRPR